jgi:dynein heavy chain
VLIIIALQDLSFGILDLSKKGFMQTIKNHLTSVYVPAIQAMERWGDLSDTPQGEETKKEFLDTLDSFVQFTDSKYTMLYIMLFPPVY